MLFYYDLGLLVAVLVCGKRGKTKLQIWPEGHAIRGGGGLKGMAHHSLQSYSRYRRQERKGRCTVPASVAINQHSLMKIKVK